MCDVLSTETYICRLNASPVPQPAASLKQSFVQLDTGTQDYHCVKMSTTILKIASLSFLHMPTSILESKALTDSWLKNPIGGSKDSESL